MMRIIKPLMVCVKGLIVSIRSKGKKPWYNIILVCGETKFNQPNLKGCLFLRQSLLEVGTESLSHTSTSPCSTFSLLEAPTLDSYSPNRACWIQQILSKWRIGTLTVPMTTEGFSAVHSEYHYKSHMRARPRLAAFRVSSEVSYVSSTEVGFRLSIIRSLICQLNKSWLHSSAEVSVPAQQKLDAFRVSSEVAHVSSAAVGCI